MIVWDDEVKWLSKILATSILLKPERARKLVCKLYGVARWRRFRVGIIIEYFH